MNLGDWVSLLLCAAALGSLAYFVWTVHGDSRDQQSFRPVWIVLLDGGTDGADRQDGPDNGGPDDGGGDGRPPRVPPRVPGYGVRGHPHRGHRRGAPQTTSTKRTV